MREAFARGAHNMVRTYLDNGKAAKAAQFTSGSTAIAAAHPEDVGIRRIKPEVHTISWIGTTNTTKRIWQGECTASSQLSRRDMTPPSCGALAKGAVNLMSFSREVLPHIITDFSQPQAGASGREGDSLPIRQRTCECHFQLPVSDGQEYFAEIESIFADADDGLSNLIRAKAAGNMLGCYGRQRQIETRTKVVQH